MLITIIITTHNRADLLREAINSVLAQEPCGAATELIVVDDASTDETPTVVGSYPAAKYVRTQQGTAAGSRNVGIEEANGEWIAFLDDDDVWLPSKLRRCCETIDSCPQARLIFSDATICDEALRPGAAWKGPKLSHDKDAYTAFLEEVITPSVVVMHREVFAAVGLFETTIPRVEDREMWLRVALHGFACIGIPESLVLYRTRAQSDAEVDYATFKITMHVLRRYLKKRHTRQPSWAHRQRILWRTRGWYVHQVLIAAGQARKAGRSAQAAHICLLALRVSPLHGLKGMMSLYSGRNNS